MSSPIIYVLLVSLSIVFISAALYGIYFVVNLLRHRKQTKEWDLESCITPEKMLEREFEPSILPRPPLAYFTLRSSKLASRPIVRNLSTLGPKSATSSSDTASIPGSATNTMSLNAAPVRPPRPSQSDDFLASFQSQSALMNDVWFPIANQDTGRWDLCVINATVTVASLGSHIAAEINPTSSSSQAKSIKTGEQGTLKTDKVKRKRRGDKQKQGALPPVLKIPELYVNARSYEDIEAKQTIPDSEMRNYLEEEYDTNFLFPTYGLSEPV